MNQTDQEQKQRASGIDCSLLRENLKLTPRERLEQLERVANDLNTLRAALVAEQAASATGSPACGPLERAIP